MRRFLLPLILSLLLLPIVAGSQTSPVNSPWLFFGGGTGQVRLISTSTKAVVGATGTSTDANFQVTGSVSVSNLANATSGCVTAGSDGTLGIQACSTGSITVVNSSSTPPFTASTSGGVVTLGVSGGYSIFPTASGTDWQAFRDTPSTRITAGTDLTWVGNALDFDNTTGYITESGQFWKLSGSNLYASSTGYNVGVGTATPAYKLDVTGSLRVTGSSTLQSVGVGGYYNPSYALSVGDPSLFNADVDIQNGSLQTNDAYTKTLYVGYSRGPYPSGFYNVYVRAVDRIELITNTNADSAFFLYASSTGTNAAGKVELRNDADVNAELAILGSNHTGTQFDFVSPTFPTGYLTGSWSRLYTDGNGLVLTTNGTNAPLIIGANDTEIARAINRRFSIGTSTQASLFDVYGTSTFQGGNVGIGITNPSWQTVINGAAQTTSSIADAGSKGGTLLLSDSGTAAGTGGTLLFGTFGTNNPNSFFAGIKALATDGSSNTAGDLAFSTRNASADAALTERVRITRLGNVGIGLAAPDTLLTLKSSADDSSGGIRLTNTSGTSNPALVWQVSDVGKIQLRDSNVAKVHLDASGVSYFNGGNVGIATTTPASPLTVVGVIESTTGGFKFPDGTTQATAAAAAVNYWSLSGGSLSPTSTTYAIGIGTASPSEKLTVATSSSTSDYAVVGLYNNYTAGNDRGDVAIDFGSNSSVYSKISSVQSSAFGNNFSNLGFWTVAAAGLTQKMVITSAGNVGIGTNSPGTKLDVVGGMLITGTIGMSTNQVLYWGGSSTGIVGDGTSAAADRFVKFNVSGLEQMRVTPDGLSIGTSTHAYKLTVNGTVQFPSLTVEASASDDAVCRDTTTFEIEVNSGATTCLLSTRKVKIGIAPLDIGLNELLKLKPVSYRNRSDGARNIGLVAEDVYEVEPRLVVLDENGEPKTVKYENMEALLIKAVQEQQAQIQILREEIHELKKQ